MLCVWLWFRLCRLSQPFAVLIVWVVCAAMMGSPPPQKSLDQTMASLRMASSRPTWMPKPRSRTTACTPPPSPRSSSPERARLSWATKENCSETALKEAGVQCDAPEDAPEVSAAEQPAEVSPKVPAIECIPSDDDEFILPSWREQSAEHEKT